MIKAKASLSVKLALILQIIWYFMFFTNFIGVMGSRSSLLQNIIWLGIPLVGIITSLIYLLKFSFTRVALTTLTLSLPICLLWILISGISKM
ncbi:hypothetical protein ATG70_1420 [Bacillus sp. es.036]|nr:hypothetical protein ATG70_1420 [Bacillus sp. es.036]